MNIFFLSRKASRAARWHCDKHVVKMILETTQLLYTAHWVLAAAAGRLPDLSRAPTLVSNPKQHGYLSIHNPKHPSAIWVRESLEHYRWLCELGMALCEEFRYRFGGPTKAHSCEEHIYWLYAHPPAELASKGWRDPPQAMPPEYKRPASIAAYRAYYRGGKAHLLTYTHRHEPHWLPSSLHSNPA